MALSIHAHCRASLSFHDSTSKTDVKEKTSQWGYSGVDVGQHEMCGLSSRTHAAVFYESRHLLFLTV